MNLNSPKVETSHKLISGGSQRAWGRGSRSGSFKPNHIISGLERLHNKTGLKVAPQGWTLTSSSNNEKAVGSGYISGLKGGGVWAFNWQRSFKKDQLVRGRQMQEQPMRAVTLLVSLLCSSSMIWFLIYLCVPTKHVNNTILIQLVVTCRKCCEYCRPAIIKWKSSDLITFS